MAKSKTPPLNKSPEFQKRMDSALGGAPTSPTQFQPMNRGTAAAAPQPDSKPASAKQSIFDEDQKELAMRAKLDQARSRLKALLNAVENKTQGLDDLLSAIDGDEEFKVYAKKQNFDTSKAQLFLEAVLAAADKVKVA